MGSPLPPDPYAALGLSKDADSTAIKTAYRKLVLKTHPDKFPDPTQKAEKSAEFHKIQQAYEILGDDDKRERYNAQVRLAELRKEAMERQHARGAAKAETSRPSPAANYDVRTPSGSTAYPPRGPSSRAYEEPRPREYYDEEDRYDEPRPKPRSAKHSYGYTTRGREETSSSRRTSFVNVFVPTSSRGDRAKTRDQTKRRDREEKKFVPVYNDSDSDERYRQEERRKREFRRQAEEEEDRKEREKEAFRRKAEAAAAAARREEEQRERERATRGRESSRRPSSRRPDVDRGYEKYLDQGAAAKEYISKHRATSVPAEEPPVRSSASRSTKYAQVRPKEKSSSKRSASREPWILSGFRHGQGSRDKSRKPARAAEAEYDEDSRRPTLEKAESSPAAMKQAMRAAEVQRSATIDSYDSRRDREETQAPPKMRRAETMPAQKASRQEEKSKANTSKPLRTEVHRHNMNDSGYSSPSTPSISDKEKEKESRNVPTARTTTTRTAYRYGAEGGVAMTTDDDFYNTVTVEPTSSSERIPRQPVSRSPIRERHPDRDSDDSGRERMPSARTMQAEKTARYTYPMDSEARRPHMARASTNQVPSGRSPKKDPYERGRTYVVSPDHVRGQSHDDRGYDRAYFGEIPKHAGTPLRREEMPTGRPPLRRNDSYTPPDVQYSRKFSEADVRYAPRGRERSAYAFEDVQLPRPPMGARGQTVM
ncbi:uncharacterized protein BKCO1_12000135 [Diplodia corticola]|uniref:Domain containing protein n=1 Tax=Diplodia corticola TaxID=236234 RepID=A0A1J9S8T2_9PEZI|nr:uncharacterized protein BKCO1_12000135 [Diplodia corticola]OJD36324.1 domain containing protein [Diplodia corticola]